MTFWSWGICPKETEVWRGCGLPEEGLGEVEEALCFLTVTSTQTREALGTRPARRGICACRGAPPASHCYEPNCGLSTSHSLPTLLLISPIVQKRTRSPQEDP